MLEIHPSPHVASDCREFVIHISTIVLGLIIAIGLDQTVVYFDHRQQRSELIDQMRAEAFTNLSILETDLNSGLIVERWDRAVLDVIRNARPENGTLTITLPPRPDFSVRRSASRAVWAVAHTNETAALIPEDMAEIFDRCDYAGSMTYKALEDIFEADSASMATESKIGVKMEPGATVRLSVADREELAQSVAHAMAANADFIYAVVSWAGTEDALAHRVHTREDMNPYIAEHRAALALARAQ